MYTDLNPSPRILLGPGPSAIHPRVLNAMATPPIGHMDPQFFGIMDEIQDMLRYVYQTRNELTLTLSASGTSGMECALCNFLEPGDSVVIGVAGYFRRPPHRDGQALWGPKCVVWIPLGAMCSHPASDRGPSCAASRPNSSPSSTPRPRPAHFQPMDGIADLVHRQGGLLLIDCVTSLGRHAGQDRRVGRGYRL